MQESQTFEPGQICIFKWRSPPMRRFNIEGVCRVISTDQDSISGKINYVALILRGNQDWVGRQCRMFTGELSGPYETEKEAHRILALEEL